MLAQPGHAFVQPGAHGAVGVVIERGHLARVDGAVRQHGVPALPDGGGAHGDGIQPRGQLGLQQQPVGQVVVADAGQHLAQPGGAQEAGGQAVAFLLEQLAQPARGGGALLGGDQVECQRQQVGGLAVVHHTPVRGHELGAKAGGHLGGERAAGGGIVRFAEQFGRLSQDLCGPREPRRAHQRRVGLGVARRVGRRLRVHPIAELEAVSPHAALVAGLRDVLDPCLHGGVLAAQHLQVAVALAQGHRHHGGGVAPAGGGERRRQDRGYDERYVAVRFLLGGQILEPGVQQRGGVVEQGSGGGEHLDVAGPAEPLVALRAVGGHVQEVAAHAPHDILVELVDTRIRALEPAGAHHVGVQHHGGDVFAPQFAGPAAHPGVAEAVEGEAGLPHFGAAAAGDVAVGGPGGAQRTHAQFAVLQHLGVANRDGSACLRGHADAHPADQVLAEVDQRLAGWGALNRQRGHFLYRTHWRHRRGREGIQVMLDYLDRLPTAGVVAGLRPAAQIEPRIVGLAVVQVGAALGPGAGVPLAVGGHGQHRPVRQGNVELRQ